MQVSRLILPACQAILTQGTLPAVMVSHLKGSFLCSLEPGVMPYQVPLFWWQAGSLRAVPCILAHFSLRCPALMQKLYPAKSPDDINILGDTYAWEGPSCWSACIHVHPTRLSFLTHQETTEIIWLLLIQNEWSAFVGNITRSIVPVLSNSPILPCLDFIHPSSLPTPE